jgi:L-lactate dehydrogenase complex protein LldG
MGTDRSPFLARVRAALTGTVSAVPPAEAGPEPVDWAAPSAEIRAAALRQWETLLARFTTELEAVAGAVYRSSPSEVPALVARIARERRYSRVAAWSETALGLPGLHAALRAEGLEVEDGAPSVAQSADQEAAPDRRRRLDRMEVGLTGVDYAVADSGSLVLFSGPGKGRLVSCLPTVHVAILRPGQLVGSLDDVGVLFEELHRQGPAGESPSSITFITGPSRTADIELSLTRGVHGPREVHVIAL